MFIAEYNRIVPVHLTKSVQKYHRNLLLLTDSAFPKEEGKTGVFHYVWIKNISRLISNQVSKKKCAIYLCDRCLHYLPSFDRLQKHKADCMKLNFCRVRLPTFKNNILRFKNHRFKLRAPFAVYCDTESLLQIPDEQSPKLSYQKHNLYCLGNFLFMFFNYFLSHRFKTFLQIY